MKYKTLFRLLLKFLGVWLFVSSLNQFISFAGWQVNSFLNSPRGFIGTNQGIIVGLVTSAIEIGIAVYIFTAPKWLVDLAIPTNRPYCPECGYDLTGATRPICNECGADVSGVIYDQGKS